METIIENSKEVRVDAERHFLAQPIVYHLGMRGIGYLPRWFSCWFARRIADISYIFYKKARENVKKNLKKIFTDMSDGDITALTLNTFRNYSTYLVDYGRFRSLKKDSLSDVIGSVQGKENLEAAFKRGKGIIILTAHLGNWELGGIYFGRQNVPITVVTYSDGIKDIDEIKERYRKEHNINTVVLDNSPFAAVELLNALRKNEIIAMLVDRYENDNNGIDVDFFGRPLRFPVGPLILAKITGASILPSFVVKTGKIYSAIIGKPIIVNDNDALGRPAQAVIAAFEKCIRRHPDQWYNFVEI